MQKRIKFNPMTGATSVDYYDEPETPPASEAPIEQLTTEERIQALEQELADLKSQLGV